ncbi:ALDH-like protein, partial [Caulochytrium protostelioides]
PLFLQNEMVQSGATHWFELHNPATQELLGYVPQATAEELREAAASCASAFKTWRKTSVLSRQRMMLDLQALVRERQDDVARNIVHEHGKTFNDARGDVFRGLQVVDHACGVPSHLMGQRLPVANDMDTYTIHEPLGVVGGITPSNFPFMIGAWIMPLAIATGNTCLLKPSERVPGATMMLAQMVKDVGIPAGVVNIVHG